MNLHFNKSIRSTRMKIPSLVFWAAIAIQALGAAAIADPERKPAPVINEGKEGTVPGQFIVMFRRGTPIEAIRSAESTVKKLDGKVRFSYDVMPGFAASLPPKALEAMRVAPGVQFIEANALIYHHTITKQPPNPPDLPSDGQDRIDQRLLPLNQLFKHSEDGTGVHAYIVDSGLRSTHHEFVGRIEAGQNFAADRTDPNDTSDTCDGHGTWVAGIVGGATYGVAKNVTIVPLRIFQCQYMSNSNTADIAAALAAVNWITNHAVRPAVVNMSMGVGTGWDPMNVLRDAITTSINSPPHGITYVFSGGNFGNDACSFTPGYTPDGITVGMIDPTDDSLVVNKTIPTTTISMTSAIGSCIDLFAPGWGIKTANIDFDTSLTNTYGTSVAAPVVAGVAALYLQNHMNDSPQQVVGAIHHAADVAGATYPGGKWNGIVNADPGSINEILHWGALNDGYDDGDPHLTTVDGVHYDFQSAGEFTYLRDRNVMEIQTRQTAVPTASPVGPNAHTGLTSCVSVNTALAARVGSHRVSYQPSDTAESGKMELRVDGTPTALSAGIDLASGGRIATSPAGNGIEIDFPDDTVLIATPTWWNSQKLWYLNVDVLSTRATAGLLGEIPSGSWLPALADGASLGPMPSGLHQWYIDLNQRFADAWRVTDKTSLFDYSPKTSAATFTRRDWPPESGICSITGIKVAKPASKRTAEIACRRVTGRDAHTDCVADVIATGERQFATGYLATQKIRAGWTSIMVRRDLDSRESNERAAFTAVVTARDYKAEPTGTVQFTIDGKKAGRPVKLDRKARATWTTIKDKVKNRRIGATYVPEAGSKYLRSSTNGEIIEDRSRD